MEVQVEVVKLNATHPVYVPVHGVQNIAGTHLG